MDENEMKTKYTNHREGYNTSLCDRARSLRREATRFEKRIWYDFLSKYPVRFHRQRPIDHYIADFYCESLKLVIEIDGVQHLSEHSVEYDEKRTDDLSKYGIMVIRFSNEAIDKQFIFVCREIDRVVNERMEQMKK